MYIFLSCVGFEECEIQWDQVLWPALPFPNLCCLTARHSQPVFWVRHQGGNIKSIILEFSWNQRRHSSKAPAVLAVTGGTLHIIGQPASSAALRILFLCALIPEQVSCPPALLQVTGSNVSLSM